MKPEVYERLEKERRERTGVLDLSMMEIETLPSELGEMDWLTELNLNYNLISDGCFLEKLTSLNSLNLGNNKISDGRFLEKLTNLTSLILGLNKISDGGFLEKLTNLTSLNLFQNQISDGHSLKKLTNLTSLDIADNKVTDFTPLLYFIKEKKMNILWDDPFSIPGIGEIDVTKNPFTTPPVEVVQQGNDAILAWYDSFKKEKGQPKHYLREIKVLLLGEGTAGKTSLLKQIKSLPFSEKESQTHGVNVEMLELGKLARFKGQADMAEAKARVWDFGGQEIMHASHQFFLSHHSIYVLLLDSRNDAKKEYWLRHIAKFGGGSPCIVAINKIDENPNYDLARNTLNEAFEFIGQRFCRISCKTGEGMDGFAATLARLIPQTELYKTPISEDWLNVKNQLEAATVERNYIDRKRFLDICEKNDVTDPVAQRTLLLYLDNLGVVLHFPDLMLPAFYVLDPHWVTIGVYKIINSPSVASGILKDEKLDFILNEEEQKQRNTTPIGINGCATRPTSSCIW
ncbi:MAG: leucine-rich repeat domain-containing protein [Saprospiraceae bacterium]|nr:leucine-rich repeat domain-containing protein [Saprospiraceae bacterium]